VQYTLTEDDKRRLEEAKDLLYKAQNAPTWQAGTKDRSVAYGLLVFVLQRLEPRQKAAPRNETLRRRLKSAIKKAGR
jgi:hypothetical protein